MIKYYSINLIIIPILFLRIKGSEVTSFFMEPLTCLHRSKGGGLVNIILHTETPFLKASIMQCIAV